MNGSYKLQIKIGDAEFNADGPEATVKEAYEHFLQAVATVQAAQPATPKKTSDSAGEEQRRDVDQDLLDRAYLRDGEIVSLRHLPPDSPSRTADAAILVLYGFKKVGGLTDVPITKLNESLRHSGLTVERLDRFIGIHNQLYRKGGTRSGGRYTLTNPGEAQAEKWLNAWFK